MHTAKDVEQDLYHWHLEDDDNWTFSCSRPANYKDVCVELGCGNEPNGPFAGMTFWLTPKVARSLESWLKHSRTDRDD